MLVESTLRYLRAVHFLEEDDWDEEHEEDAEDQPVVLRHCYNVKRTDKKGIKISAVNYWAELINILYIKEALSALGSTLRQENASLYIPIKTYIRS